MQFNVAVLLSLLFVLLSRNSLLSRDVQFERNGREYCRYQKNLVMRDGYARKDKIVKRVSRMWIRRRRSERRVEQWVRATHAAEVRSRLKVSFDCRSN